ncbi:MAG: hypothetical protein M1831_005715 [Alyxoria varia]|nr:MAG: hypothetical protein M1831_005715 [Alyxoria varia]
MTIKPYLNGEDEVDSELSNKALDALQAFYSEQDVLDLQYEDLKAKSFSLPGPIEPYSMSAFAEDWNASQFWIPVSLKYDEDTANKLAQAVLQGCTADSKVAIVSTPSVFVALKEQLKRLPDSPSKPEIRLFEFDSRFAVFAEFVRYDFNKPFNLPGTWLFRTPELVSKKKKKKKKKKKTCLDAYNSNTNREAQRTVRHHSVRSTVLERGLPDENAIRTVSQTIQWLSSPTTTKPPRLIVCTGAQVTEQVHKLYKDFGVQQTGFKPTHANNLSNAWVCSANFEVAQGANMKKGSETEPRVTVTAQQSRFHVDASNAPTSNEIEITDLNLAVGKKELLSHATLKLKENGHYVLVGRNGTGKSTLMRALADGSIPGVASNIRILLLGQSSILANQDSEDAAADLVDVSVLDRVLKSDTRREKALNHSKLLSEALDNTEDPLAPVRVYRQLQRELSRKKYEEANMIATRRSGARGLKARKDLISAEEDLKSSIEKLSLADKEEDGNVINNETIAAVDMLADLQSFLSAIDSAGSEGRARRILHGLGFADEAIAKSYTNLSGGWRTRCTLACALFQSADILLLDECTNFLDLPAIIWLQSYVQQLTDRTVVVITHDRDFADAVADELLILREQTLEHFAGNLSNYEGECRKYSKWMTKMKEAQEKKTKHIESTIASNVSAAKRTGDDKKLKQAASRKKKLEERTGLEVSAKGGRFKLNRDLPGYHTTNRGEIEVPKMDPQIKMTLPMTPPELRFPGALVSLEKVSFAYPGSKTYNLFEVDLVIHPGERVGLAGLNGSGKSTLVKLAVGRSEMGASSGASGLNPSKGKVDRHSRVRIGCFSQHSVEALEEKGAANIELTALRELYESAEASGTPIGEQEARALLSGLGLVGRIASDVPVAALSGGQKVRSALAKLMHNPPHLLVLDEVTTHLDADTVTALAETLRKYQGAILLVTHDRFFMRTVVEGESPYAAGAAGDDGEEDGESSDEEDDEAIAKPGIVYRIVKGRLKLLKRGMTEYEEIVEKQLPKT